MYASKIAPTIVMMYDFMRYMERRIIPRKLARKKYFE